MTEPHFCPGCGAEQKPFARYPWYFCKDCRNLAVDGDGAALCFGNVSFSGGFQVWAADREPVICSGAACLIRGRPVLVREARFGGIVAEPLRSSLRLDRGVIDLTRGWPDPADGD